MKKVECDERYRDGRVIAWSLWCQSSHEKKAQPSVALNNKPSDDATAVPTFEVRELWSTAEEVHLRPGHHWLFELGDDGNGSCVEKTFALGTRKWVDYKGVRFYNGESALVVKRWVHRVDDDAAGLTFADWDPVKDADPDQPAAAMIVNSSELRAAGFSLKELLPPELDAAARGVVSGRTHGAGIRQLQGVSPSRWVLHADLDNEFRSRCE